MTIAVDFDGTIVENRYPEIGSEIPFAIRSLKMLQELGHCIILWTCREGDEQTAAIEWCRKRGLEFYAVNLDFPEENEEKNVSYSRKIKADIFIDDRQVGGLPDWGTIYEMIKDGKTYEQVMSEQSHPEDHDYEFQNLPRKKWWQF